MVWCFLYGAVYFPSGIHLASLINAGALAFLGCSKIKRLYQEIEITYPINLKSCDIKPDIQRCNTF